jgi:hypothetical protein
MARALAASTWRGAVDGTMVVLMDRRFAERSHDSAETTVRPFRPRHQLPISLARFGWRPRTINEKLGLKRLAIYIKIASWKHGIAVPRKGYFAIIKLQCLAEAAIDKSWKHCASRKRNQSFRSHPRTST